MDTVMAELPHEMHFFVTSNHTFGVVPSANGGGMLPEEVCVFWRIFAVGAEQSVWESVGVGEILGEILETKDVENDAGISCCHRCGVLS